MTSAEAPPVLYVQISDVHRSPFENSVWFFCERGAAPRQSIESKQRCSWIEKKALEAGENQNEADC
jgi:hypothetical protein